MERHHVGPGMSSLALRPFAPADVDSVFRLWSACEGLGHGPGDDPPSLGRFLDRNPGLSFVAEEEGRIVGAVLCGHDGRRGFLYRLAVAPSHRRRGLAADLVSAGLRGLAEAGIPRALVFVLADNDSALGFWRAVGCVDRPELRLLSIDVPSGSPAR